MFLLPSVESSKHGICQVHADVWEGEDGIHQCCNMSPNIVLWFIVDVILWYSTAILVSTSSLAKEHPVHPLPVQYVHFLMINFFNSSMQYQQISRFCFYFLDKSLSWWSQSCEVYHNCCQLTSCCLTNRLTLSAQYFESHLELFASFCLLTHLNVLLCGLICNSLYQLPVTMWNWRHFRKYINQNLHLCL